MDEHETKMIFRKFADGDIIALMPEIAYDRCGEMVESYMHIGQHSGASLSGVIDRTESANPSEYADLLIELTNIGYNVKVVKRDHPKYRRTRTSYLA